MKRNLKIGIFLIAQVFTTLLFLTPHVFAEEKSVDEKPCVFVFLLSEKKDKECLIEVLKDKNKSVTFFSSVSELETPIIPKVYKKDTKKIEKTSFQPLKLNIDNSSTLSADLLFNLVNDFRIKNNLPAFEKSPPLCELAASRATELPQEILVTGRLHSGFYSRNLPYFATENVIYAKSEQQALNWWLNSTIHRNTIIGNYKYSCSACQNQMCSQIFSSLMTPKQIAAAK